MASDYIEKDLGIVTAYGEAVAGGYRGTRDDFRQLLARLATSSGMEDPLRGYTLYVSDAGNDTTGDGTQAKPFRNIQRAIDEIPIYNVSNDNKIYFTGTQRIPNFSDNIYVTTPFCINRISVQIITYNSAFLKVNADSQESAFNRKYMIHISKGAIVQMQCTIIIDPLSNGATAGILLEEHSEFLAHMPIQFLAGRYSNSYIRTQEGAMFWSQSTVGDSEGCSSVNGLYLERGAMFFQVGNDGNLFINGTISYNAIYSSGFSYADLININISSNSLRAFAVSSGSKVTYMSGSIETDRSLDFVDNTSEVKVRT